ncbi:hypothetical protein [Sulfurimonas sp.]|uniref:hypothetical protein n=1 Tax=Sulfurimonas sp. TaxID=2022749 RepID=UPI003567E4CF
MVDDGTKAIIVILSLCLGALFYALIEDKTEAIVTAWKIKSFFQMVRIKLLLRELR